MRPGNSVVERAEGLGDLQRRMVRQHDAAGADADRRGGGGDMADDHRRGGRGDAGHVVMLGEPEAAIAQRLGMAGKLGAPAQRVGGGGALRDRAEIEDGGGDHGVRYGARASARRQCRMFERRDDAAQFGQPLHPPDQRIARLRLAAVVVEDVLAVVGAERDRGVARPAARRFASSSSAAAISATMSVPPVRCSSS